LVWLTPNLLASFHAQILCVWNISISDDFATHNHVLEKFSSGLQAVVTCVALRQQNGPDCVAVGDNRGHVSTYELDSSNMKGTSPFEKPLSIRRLHDTENVNDLYWTSTTSLLSVGNDGRVVQSTVLDDGTLLAGVSVPVFSLSGISRILPLSKSPFGEFLVAGYVSNTLSVVDPSRSYEFASLDTGGRARWTTLDIDNQDRIRVAICSNQKDGRTDILLEQQTIVSEFSRKGLAWSYGITLHHETVFDAYAVHLSCNRTMFITGSEDCSSRLLLWSSGRIVRSQLLTPQESGVRAVCASPVPDFASTLIAIGGSKLCLQLFLVHHADSDAESFRVEALNSRKTSNAASIDHRINALSSTRIDYRDRGLHLIACGDSSGQIFVYVLGESSRTTSTGSFVHESTRPILSLDFFVARDQIWLVFGTSGGDVSVLQITLQENDTAFPEPSSELVGNYQGHTMGTNALATMLTTQEKDLTVWIASGGDDQRLTICQVQLMVQEDHFMKVWFEEPIYIELASSSAIRSVRWIDYDQLATVSYSGELSIWRLVGNEWQRECSRTAVVGDINGMALVKTGLDSQVLIGVAGIGFQVFELLS
jgi:WD40 repeat protein